MYISNNIVFNGIITNDFVDVGDGYVAVPMQGQDGSKFPIILVKSTLEKTKEAFKLKDKVSASGKLTFINDSWVIICKYMTTIPENSELKEEIKTTFNENKIEKDKEIDRDQLIEKLEKDKNIKKSKQAPKPIKRKRLITVEEKIK